MGFFGVRAKECFTLKWQVRAAAASSQRGTACHIPESYFLFRKKTSIFTRIHTGASKYFSFFNRNPLPCSSVPLPVVRATNASSTTSLFMTFHRERVHLGEDIQLQTLCIPPPGPELDSKVKFDIPGAAGRNAALWGSGPDLRGSRDARLQVRVQHVNSTGSFTQTVVVRGFHGFVRL